MRANYKPNFKNRPPHILGQDGFYFITSRTINGHWFLQPDKYKKILLDIIKTKTKDLNVPLIAYAILTNHYHLIVDMKNGAELSKLIRQINGSSARQINQADSAIDRKIWWNYFETYLKDERDFYIHLNYIHQNPIKHGSSKDFNYDFSSYNAWVVKKGQEYLDDCFNKYPIIDFKVFNDEF